MVGFREEDIYDAKKVLQSTQPYGLVRLLLPILGMYVLSWHCNSYGQISEITTDKKKRMQRAVPWGILIGQHGGSETEALKSIERGDVIEIEDQGKTFFAWTECSRALLIHQTKLINFASRIPLPHS